MSLKKVDAKTRVKLLGLLPFSKDATIFHTPKIYRMVEGVPEDFIPVFRLRGLSREDSLTLKKLLRTGQTNQSEKAYTEFVRKALCGWENFFDLGTCEEIEFEAGEDGGASTQSIESIPDSILSDLLMAISAMSAIVSMEKLGLKS